MSVNASQASSSTAWCPSRTSIAEYNLQTSSSELNIQILADEEGEVQFSEFERSIITDQLRSQYGQEVKVRLFSDQYPRLTSLRSLAIDDESVLERSLEDLTKFFEQTTQQRYDVFIDTIGKPNARSRIEWEKKALCWIDMERKFSEYSRKESLVKIKSMNVQRALLSLPGVSMLGTRIIWMNSDDKILNRELFALSIRFPQTVVENMDQADQSPILSLILSELKHEDAQAYLKFLQLIPGHKLAMLKYNKRLKELVSALTGIDQVWPVQKIETMGLNTVIPGLSLLIGQRLSVIDDVLRKIAHGDTIQETEIEPYLRIQKIQQVLDNAEKAQVDFYQFILRKFLPLQRNQLSSLHGSIQQITQKRLPVATPVACVMPLPTKRKPQVKKRANQCKKIQISSCDRRPSIPRTSLPENTARTDSSSSTTSASSSEQAASIASKIVPKGSIFDHSSPRLHERVNRWKSIRPNQEIHFPDYRLRDMNRKHQEKVRFRHGFPWLADHLMRNPLYTHQVKLEDGVSCFYGIAEICYSDGSSERGYVEWSLSKTAVLYHRFFNKQTDQELLQLAAERVFTASSMSPSQESGEEKFVEPESSNFLFDPVLESYTFEEENTKNRITFFRIN